MSRNSKESNEASLKMARNMVEEYKAQVTKAVTELEESKATRSQLNQENHGLLAALEVANGQLSATKQERDSSERSLHERINDAHNELRSERQRFEALHSEYELMSKRGDDEVSSSQFKRRQMTEQLNYLEAQLLRARSDAEVSHQEYKTCAAERDYLKLEQSNLKEQTHHLEGELSATQDALSSAEQSRERQAETFAAAQGELSQRCKTLEDENSRLRNDTEDKLGKAKHSDKNARKRLATAPVGSTVQVEQNQGTVKPPLIGQKGIVIAHAVSPEGEPGALVGVCDLVACTQEVHIATSLLHNTTTCSNTSHHITHRCPHRTGRSSCCWQTFASSEDQALPA